MNLINLTNIISNFIKYLIAIILFTLSFTAFSQTDSQSSSPTDSQSDSQTDANAIPDCTQEGFSFKDHGITFNPDNKLSHRVFLIHNSTSGAIVINQLNTTGAMGGAGWTSKIDANQWSALAMSQSNLALNCESFSPPYYRMMDCSTGLSVCSYQSKGNTGSFWIVENTSFPNVIKTLKQRKIID
jgi:hypothetical protein